VASVEAAPIGKSVPEDLPVWAETKGRGWGGQFEESNRGRESGFGRHRVPVGRVIDTRPGGVNAEEIISGH